MFRLCQLQPLPHPLPKEKNIPSPIPCFFRYKRKRKREIKIFTSIRSFSLFWKAHSRGKQTDICECLESGRRNEQVSSRACQVVGATVLGTEFISRLYCFLLPTGREELLWMQKERNAMELMEGFSILIQLTLRVS